MDAVRTSETSVYFYETTRHCIPEGCHLQWTFYLLPGNVLGLNYGAPHCALFSVLSLIQFRSKYSPEYSVLREPPLMCKTKFRTHKKQQENYGFVF
jgi:hypothetical protein